MLHLPGRFLRRRICRDSGMRGGSLATQMVDMMSYFEIALSRSFFCSWFC